MVLEDIVAGEPAIAELIKIETAQFESCRAARERAEGPPAQLKREANFTEEEIAGFKSLHKDIEPIDQMSAVQRQAI